METGIIILKQYLLADEVKELNVILDNIKEDLTSLQLSEIVAKICFICILIAQITSDVSELINKYYKPYQVENYKIGGVYPNQKLLN